jgi:hypothetical protein
VLESPLTARNSMMLPVTKAFFFFEPRTNILVGVFGKILPRALRSTALTRRPRCNLTNWITDILQDGRCLGPVPRTVFHN